MFRRAARSVAVRCVCDVHANRRQFYECRSPPECRQRKRHFSARFTGNKGRRDPTVTGRQRMHSVGVFTVTGTVGHTADRVRTSGGDELQRVAHARRVECTHQTLAYGIRMRYICLPRVSPSLPLVGSFEGRCATQYLLK